MFEIKIEKPDNTVYKKAKQNWDAISKPLDGLGDFEELICRISAILGDEYPDITKRAAVIFCADNGIVEEGVTQSDKSITLAVAKALGSGKSTANRLCAFAGVTPVPVDIGISCDEEIPGVRNMKLCRGTRNFLHEPAMTEKEAFSAIEKGMDIVKELAGIGYSIIATGEMGIGNTTTSTAILCSLLGLDIDEVTGRGAGLDDAGLLKKKQVIKIAVNKYGGQSAFDILRSVGGLDIAGLAGLYIGGAIHHVPIVVDGVISAAAAVVAEALIPGAKNYMIPSHAGRGRLMSYALSSLGLKPYINGNMALGEGSGAIMLFPILDMVMDYYKNGSVFDDYGIEKYKRFL